MSEISMEQLVSLCKRRGFVYQASELYGGISGFWDYGPYGTELVKNLEASWWKWFVWSRPNVVGVNTAIIQHPKLWQASGHVDTFTDPLVDCKECKHRFRADTLTELNTSDTDSLNDALRGRKCPNCGGIGTLTDARKFNLMFQTVVGPVSDTGNQAYLRPETAGGIFAQFANVLSSSRQKIPFGIAQAGKAFRNEITPGDFIFRVREFTQLELEYFVHPKDAEEQYQTWLKECQAWLGQIGLNKKRLRVRAHNEEEKAHYAIAASDIEYEYPFGFRELYGIANRGDYDLLAHSKHSGKDLSVLAPDGVERYTPHVIEPSVGIERLLLAILHSAYREETVASETRVVLGLAYDIAPVKVAILPLSKDPKLSKLAKLVWDRLSGSMNTEYDETQSIGRRYRRQDEIGTPLCITIDFESLEDESVTIRDRDTMKQGRVKIDDIVGEVSRALAVDNS